MQKLLSRFLLLLFSLLTLTGSSQTGGAKILEKQFKQFDGNESGWLSGKELDACACRSFDKNGDNEVTLDEYVSGKGSGKAVAKTMPAGAVKVPAATALKGSQNTGGQGDLRGTWWYTTMIFANGKVYKLGSRSSNLELKDGGRYTLSTWMGGSNTMRTEGNYSVSPGKLVLQRDGGKKEAHQLSFSDGGRVMTVIAADGSGYTAERSK